MCIIELVETKAELEAKAAAAKKAAKKPAAKKPAAKSLLQRQRKKKPRPTIRPKLKNNI